MIQDKKIYFLSDAHLGAPAIKNPKLHEKILVNWLDSIKNEAAAIYLLGDIFDFWFEYKTVIPRGFSRFIGKLCELSDMGIELHFFIGNHDIWTFDFLEKEIGMIVHKKPEIVTLYNKKFFLAHGDGLGDNNKTFLFLRKVFHSHFCQKCFSFLHPNIGLKLGSHWSNNSRKNKGYFFHEYLGEDKEPLIQFAKKYPEPIDYFIFGHRHLMIDLMLKNKNRIIILGDWIEHFSYASFDGENLILDQYYYDGEKLIDYQEKDIDEPDL